jgi:hypothetical protein
MPAFKLWVFDKGIVFFRIAEMKALGNTVAQVLAVQFTFAIQILLYLFSRHIFSFVCLTFSFLRRLSVIRHPSSAIRSFPNPHQSTPLL